ncbi:MAG TPA: histidine phosphatase family protein [Pontiellaceae bacterium]|nr:histidine phosphatase family protein [Pontiellaceae bacterium]
MAAIKTLYFMRHARSEANLKDILASRLDFPLTEEGLRDAEAIAREFAAVASVDRIVSSPLIRARQTARPFAEACGLTVQTDERLTEQHLGIFSGLTYAELDTRPDYMHDRAQRWTWVPAGGGESYQMIADRLRPFFLDLESMTGSSILFVTHAVTMRLIRATLEQTLPEYPQTIAKNGEIWKVSYTQYGAPHRVESIFLGGSAAAVSRA